MDKGKDDLRHPYPPVHPVSFELFFYFLCFFSFDSLFAFL